MSQPDLGKRLFVRLREFGYMRSANRYCDRITTKVKERFGPKAEFAINKLDEGSIQVELIIPFTDNEINLIGIG